MMSTTTKTEITRPRTAINISHRMCFSELSNSAGTPSVRPYTAPAVLYKHDSVLRAATFGKQIGLQDTPGQWGPLDIPATRLWPITERTVELDARVEAMSSKYLAILEPTQSIWSMTALRFGTTETDSVVTIYIIVETNGILDIVQSAMTDADTMCLIAAVGTFRLATSELLLTSENSLPGIGATISGEENPNKIGTMACLLRGKNTASVYALSCAHVTDGQDRISCPTKADVKYTQDLLQGNLDNYEHLLENASASECPEHVLPTLHKYIRQIKTSLEKIAAINVNLGRTVLEVWDFTTVAERTDYIDIALIATDSSQFPPGIPHNKMPGVFVKGVRAPTVGMNVIATSRHGLVTGTVNAYPTQHSVEVNIRGTLRRGTLSSWTIVGKTEAAFSRPGDSGALVVDQTSNEAVGMLFGGGTCDVNRRKDITFFTPMPVVLETCKSLGYDLTLA